MNPYMTDSPGPVAIFWGRVAAACGIVAWVCIGIVALAWIGGIVSLAL